MALHDSSSRSFASDNAAGAHPEVLAALSEANGGHVTSYGDDPYTRRLQEVVRGHFGAQAEAFPVFNGTGANVLSLQAVSPPWGAVICTASAHVNTDENGAPERTGGLKLVPVPAPEGKLTPDLVSANARGLGDEHHAQPSVVSLTQATELGTVYTAAEVGAVADQAHALGLSVHIDGARLANAAASLGASLGALTTEVGADILSLGGTKNGALLAEAVVVLNAGAAQGLKYLRKMDMQLGSKMRFLSAQLVALFEGDLWLRSATHANAMAERLARAVAAMPGVRISQPVQANAVFAVLPPGVADRLREKHSFYDMDPTTGEVRWMCAFDTLPADVDAFVADLADVLATA
jgi:threonine aldolase